MKRRVLVMNGSRIVQSDSGEGWNSEKVEKAFNLKAGIYNIYTASPADKKRASSGVIVHADKDSVYQQCGKKIIIMHSRNDFDRVPSSTLSYFPTPPPTGFCGSLSSPVSLLN
ncbi:KfrB domain-containing protein, partial [Thiolapillus sp.]|uniref:KfrB domain-containing protein n=1 Tax=Thiolapillus sp. TaxID=2017437 RepID=UPI003AF9E53E